MQLITFEMNQVKFGVDINYVKSIETKMDIVGVPNSPSYISGIVNLHGEVIAIYDLASRFGYGHKEGENIIVVELQGIKIGLEIERVKELINVEDAKIVSMPELMNTQKDGMSHIAAREKELVVMVELEYLIPEEALKEIEKVQEQA